MSLVENRDVLSDQRSSVIADVKPGAEQMSDGVKVEKVLNLLNRVSVLEYTGQKWDLRREAVRLGVVLALPAYSELKRVGQNMRGIDTRLWQLKPDSSGIEAVMVQEGPRGLIGPKGNFRLNLVLANGFGGENDAFVQSGLMVSSVLDQVGSLIKSTNVLRAAYINAREGDEQIQKYIGVESLKEAGENILVRVLIENEVGTLGFIDIPRDEFNSLTWGKPIDSWVKELLITKTYDPGQPISEWMDRRIGGIRWKPVSQWHENQEAVPTVAFALGNEAKTFVDSLKDPRIPVKVSMRQRDKSGIWDTSFIFEHGILGLAAKTLVENVLGKLQTGMQRREHKGDVSKEHIGVVKFNPITKSDSPMWMEAVGDGLDTFIKAINAGEQWFGPLSMIDRIPTSILDRYAEMTAEDFAGKGHRTTSLVRMLSLSMMAATGNRAVMLSVAHNDAKTGKPSLGMVTTGTRLGLVLEEMDRKKIDFKGSLMHDTLYVNADSYLDSSLGEWLRSGVEGKHEWFNTVSYLSEAIKMAKEFGAPDVTYLAELVKLARDEGEAIGNIVASYVAAVMTGGMGHISDIDKLLGDFSDIVLDVSFDTAGSKFVSFTVGLIKDMEGNVVLTLKDLLSDPSEMLSLAIKYFIKDEKKLRKLCQLSAKLSERSGVDEYDREIDSYLREVLKRDRDLKYDPTVVLMRVKKKWFGWESDQNLLEFLKDSATETPNMRDKAEKMSKKFLHLLSDYIKQENNGELSSWMKQKLPLTLELKRIQMYRQLAEFLWYLTPTSDANKATVIELKKEIIRLTTEERKLEKSIKNGGI